MVHTGAVTALFLLSVLGCTMGAPAEPADGDEGGTPLPYVGEIRWVAFSYAPRGWAICHGQYVGMKRFRSLLTVIRGDGETKYAENMYGPQRNDMFSLPNLIDTPSNDTESLSEDEVQTLTKDMPLVPIIALEGALPTSPRYPIIHPDKKFSIDSEDLDTMDLPEAPQPPLDTNIDQTQVQKQKALEVDDPEDLPLREKMYK